MFKLVDRDGRLGGGSCFNLLSEILFVQAAGCTWAISSLCQFQSLERDSVCSSFVLAADGDYLLRVSIS